VEITEVRIKLMDEPGERLKAFCSITFDNSFVVRDLKIIEGASGPFVAMPSRKMTAHCPQCGMKNHLRAQYCNQCGNGLAADRMPLDADGRAKLYADIAHPINSACREMIQEVVVREYDEELERSQHPDYVSRYDEFDLDYGDARRPGPPAGNYDTRIDPPHQRGNGHVAAHQRDASPDPARDRRGIPSPKSAPRSAQRSPFDGFGAGIFPQD
jgi:stage V sporulation protein G